MTNPFEELNTKIDQVISINSKLLHLIESPPVERKISFRAFCEEYHISRPTAYAWAEKGLIKIVRLGGRNYILVDSISIDKKLTHA